MPPLKNKENTSTEAQETTSGHDLNSIEVKMLLLFERDMPMVQQRLLSLESKAESVDDKLSKLNNNILSKLEEKTQKQEMPFYKDFQKILILLFAVGFMILSGVKAYEGLATSLLPRVTISENHSTASSGSAPERSYQRYRSTTEDGEP